MSQVQDTSVILVCAGNATRMQGKNKILLPLGDTNVIGMSMRAFEACPRVAEIIVVARALSKGTTMIAVHDGARPLVKPEHIAQVIRDASVFGGATLGVPVKDTIKVVNDHLIVDTPYRPHLFITQTPQVFKRQLYFEAVTFAEEHALDFTDDCQLIEAINCKVYMTEGDYTNIKITTPEDIAIAEILLARQKEEA